MERKIISRVLELTRYYTLKIVIHKVEKAGLLFQSGPTLLRRPVFAKEALKDQTRVGFRGKWCCGRRPREVILINTGVTSIALPNRLHEIHRHLER